MEALQLKSIPISVVKKDYLTLFLIERIKNNQPFLPVVTFNVTMFGLHNNDLLAWLKNNALFTADGIGIVLMLYFKYFRWVSRYAGIDMVADILKTKKDKFRVALIGSKPQCIASTQSWVETMGHSVVFCKDGFSTFSITDFNQLSDSKPQLILVAMGAPNQDQFIYNISKSLKTGVAIGVGGAFDVWSGCVNRAPGIWQTLGLEWLYRSLKEPFRFKRVLKGLYYFLKA